MNDQHIKNIAFTIDEVKQNPQVREIIKNADIFWGYNTERDTICLYYGKDTLEQIAANRLTKGVELKLAAVKFRESTEELEFVMATCVELKGSFIDYHDGGRIIERDDPDNPFKSLRGMFEPPSNN